MNNAGAMDSRLIVILNDNDMSIAPPVGAHVRLPVAAVVRQTFLWLREYRQAAGPKPPAVPGERAVRAEEYARGTHHWRHLVRGTRHLLCRPNRRPQSRSSPARCCATSAMRKPAPVLVHCVTQKGKGYAPAETSADKYHGVSKFNVVTGAQAKWQVRASDLHQGVRGEPHGGSPQGRQDRGHHGGDAVGHRARSVRQGVSRTDASMWASRSSTP